MKRLIIIILALFCVIAHAKTKPLAPDQAFKFSATARDAQTALLNWRVAPGYYLYKNNFTIRAIDQVGKAKLSPPILPLDFAVKQIPGLGNYEVYKGNVRIIQPILHDNISSITLQVGYQGCSEAGFCYPPTSKVVTINLSGDYMMPATTLNIDVAPIKPKKAQPTTHETAQQINPQTRIESLLANDNLLGIIAGFFVFGVLIAFTPCVLPMIPILSGIIIGKGKITHWHAFLLSLAYVLGMAITYAVAGIIFGYIGSSIQTWFQQPWLIILFTLLFIAMALSLFDFYSLELPASLQSRLANLSAHQKHSSYIGVALMGVLSTLILSPCVTPPLVAVLAYISTSGSPAVGGLALFSMGIGMGLPLLVIGAFGPKLLPHTGKWMTAIKHFMGVLLLVVAIWMISRILPDTVTLLLWALLLLGCGIALGALTSSSNFKAHVRKAIGLILFIYGIVLASMTLFGHSEKTEHIHFTPVKNIEEVKTALKKASAQGKPTLLDFYADWCVACKEMDRFTFNDPKVITQLKKMVLLRANVTDNDLQDKLLQKHYGVVAPPTIIFFNRQGQEIKNTRLIGEVSAANFLKHVDKNILK